MLKFKKIFIFILFFISVFCLYGCKENNNEIEKDDNYILSYSDELYPLNSSNFSINLAKLALKYASCYSKATTSDILTNDNYDILVKNNYDKDASDPSHTSPYTIGLKEVDVNGEIKKLITVVIEGTMDSEWISNFDFAPSHNDNTVISENFLYCALDIYEVIKPIIKELNNPLILVTGFSRGAAVANLLGMLLDSTFNRDNIYVYTFATPCTIRNINLNYHNIFNIINESDIVPSVPLESLNYKRLGYDIILKNDECVKTKKEIIDVLDNLVPSISSYYNTRHSITSSGKSDSGITTFELIVILFSLVSNGDFENSDALNLISILSSDSDYYPLYTTIYNLYLSGGIKNIASEHSFDKYESLLNSYKGE